MLRTVFSLRDANAGLRCRAGSAIHFSRNRARAKAGRRQKHDPRPVARPRLALSGTGPGLSAPAAPRLSTVACGISFIPMTNHDSRFSDSGY
jgi:hypothetical protein